MSRGQSDLSGLIKGIAGTRNDVNSSTSDSQSARYRSGVEGSVLGLDPPAPEHMFAAEPSAVSAARALVVSVVPAGMGDAGRYDAALVMSELVSNAIEHGCGDAVFVTVRALGTDAVGLRVRNESERHPRPQPWTMPGAESARGRGLAVVHTVATELAVAEEEGQVIVTAVIGARSPR